MPTIKPWYASKTIWAGIIGTIRAVYLTLQVVLPTFTNIQLPPIPPVIDGILGIAIGGTTIHGRWTADSTIGSAPANNT